MYARPLGKGYQITALRAAAVFQHRPTVQNAAGVIAECDRGGEEGAVLVSEEIREKVAAEVENKRQGVLAALDGAVNAAQQLVADPKIGLSPDAHLVLVVRQRFSSKLLPLAKQYLF